MYFDGQAVWLILAILVPGFSPGRPGLLHRAVLVDLVVDKLALQQAGVHRLHPINIIPPFAPFSCSSVCCQRYIILQIDSVAGGKTKRENKQNTDLIVTWWGKTNKHHGAWLYTSSDVINLPHYCFFQITRWYYWEFLVRKTHVSWPCATQRVGRASLIKPGPLSHFVTKKFRNCNKWRKKQMHGGRSMFSYLKYRDTHVTGRNYDENYGLHELNSIRFLVTVTCVTMTQDVAFFACPTTYRYEKFVLLTIWCGQTMTADRPEICHEKEMAATIHSEF
jgi:hypothetical protein